MPERASSFAKGRRRAATYRATEAFTKPFPQPHRALRLVHAGWREDPPLRRLGSVGGVYRPLERSGDVRRHGRGRSQGSAVCGRPGEAPLVGSRGGAPSRPVGKTGNVIDFWTIVSEYEGFHDECHKTSVLGCRCSCRGSTFRRRKAARTIGARHQSFHAGQRRRQ